MKLFRIAAIYASLCVTQADYLTRRWFGKCVKLIDVNAWIASINGNTPAAIGAAIMSSFKYTPDGAMDYALDPCVFFAVREDDCDGFAMFAEYVLNRLGYADVSRVYAKASSGRGHVVCVCKYQGKFWQVGNWTPFELQGSTLAEIGQEISQRMQGNMTYAIRFKDSSYQEYAAG